MAFRFQKNYVTAFDRSAISIANLMERGAGKYVFITVCGVASLIIVLAIILYLSDDNILLYYGDAAYHLSAARKLFDSENPGLSQLGRVWLPLPLILFMFPSLSDFLFYSGFAGLAINVPALALTTFLLHKILLETGKVDSRLALVFALLYPLNPNVMYIVMTAMTEITFILFFVASAYYFQRWTSSHKNSDLLLCSGIVAASTLCRYEAWPLVIFILSILLIAFVKRRMRLSVVVSAAALSIFGIGLWCAWNMYSFGNPLDFATAEYYSPASAATSRPVSGTLYLQPLNVIGIYGITALIVYGPIMLWVGMRGFAKHFKLPLFWYLVLPAAFTVIAMISGIAEMSIWFNSRFILFLTPLLLIAGFHYLRLLGSKRAFAMICLIFCHILIVMPVLHSLTYFDNVRDSKLLPIPFSTKIGASDISLGESGVVTINQPNRYEYQYQIPGDVPLTGVVTLIDALFNFNYPDNLSAIEAGAFLRSNYDSGKIMTIAGSGQGQKVMITSWIKYAEYDEMTEADMQKASFQEPWKYDKWIVIAKNPEWNALKSYQYWHLQRDVLDEHYHKVYENDYYEILKLNDDKLGN